MLNHNDDIIDHEPDRRRDAAQRHDVEARPDHREQQHRRRTCPAIWTAFGSGCS